jgi:winged helix DNA-binding protein
MLDRALERRSLVQATLLRGTIHIVSAGDFWPLAEGIRRARRLWWARVHKPWVDTVDLDAAATALRRRLAGTTAGRAEVVELMKRFDPPDAPYDVAWTGVDVDLVRVPPAGTWDRRRAHTFALAEDWLPRPDVTEDEGLELLARRYLAAFGPATRAELADWAGLPPAFFQNVLGRMRLRRFRDVSGRELLDLPRAPLPPADTPAPVRFLPTFDATLLVHARRTGILPEPYRPLIFNTKMPQSVATFLVDGAVAGTWRYAGGRILTEAFGRLTRAERSEVAEEAERLGLLFAE